MSKSTTSLVWETDLPLFGPEMRRQWNMAMLATATVMVLLLGTIFLAQHELEALPMMAAMVAGTTAGLWLLGWIIMALLFRGKFRVRYTLDGDGILQETVDTVAKTANRAAIIVGILARKPGVVGSGLIARAQESQSVRWKGAFSVLAKPERHIISLRNGWRTVMFVQCTAENYAAVVDRITAETTQHKTTTRVEKKSPLPFYLKHTGVILLTALPLFQLADEYHIHLMAPILVLFFMIATLWLINIFAWVVYAGLLYLAVGVLMDLGRVRESMFSPGETFTGFDVMDSNENFLILTSLLAAGYLGWMCWRALHGGYLALLVRDAADMDGE